MKRTTTLRTAAQISVVILGITVSLRGDEEFTRFRPEHVAAARSLAAGDWKEAAAAYRVILEGGRTDVLFGNAKFGLAKALIGAGDWAGGLNQLGELIEPGEALPARDRVGEDKIRQAWKYTAYREAGRVHERNRHYERAVLAYRSASGAFGEDRTFATWRARVRMDAARCLALDGKHKEAIVLLTESLPELDPPEFAGMRALQKATLARHYLGIGERDWSVTLLEQIRSDPQLDQLHYDAADAKLKGEAWKPRVTGKMRTRKGPDYLAIVSEGRFELRIALQSPGKNLFGDNHYGWIKAWYNLEEDPFRTTNLAGLGWFPFVTPLPIRDPGRRDPEFPKVIPPELGFSKGAEAAGQGLVRFELLEDTPLRVRTRTSHADWPGEVVEYTVYPTGQVFVSASFELELPRPLNRVGQVSWYVSRSDWVNWREVTMSGSTLSGERSHHGEGRFALAHGSDVPSFRSPVRDDLLMCLAHPEPRYAILSAGMNLVWRASALKFDCDPGAGRQGVAAHLRIYPRTIDTASAARPYVDDYQSPATLVVPGGKVVRDDPGDLNGDGYNESEGCYVVEGSGRVKLQAGKAPRHQPVIKFLRVDVNGIPDVIANGAAAGKEHYNLARTGAESFLLQWLGVQPAGESLAIELK